MTRSPDTLEAVGAALFGNSWQTALAAALEVSDRTMRRWAAGETSIPDGVWADLAKLCRSHSSHLAKLANVLDHLTL